MIPSFAAKRHKKSTPESKRLITWNTNSWSFLLRVTLLSQHPARRLRRHAPPLLRVAQRHSSTENVRYCCKRLVTVGGSSMINLPRLPVGAKYLVLGLVVGAAYSVGMSSVWGLKIKSPESTRAWRGSQASACTRGAIYQLLFTV